MRVLYSIIFLLLIHFVALSQSFPTEDQKLNYRLVGFSFEDVTKAKDYEVEVANGRYFDQDSFKNNIVLTLHSQEKKAIIELPSFGQEYTWRVTSKINNTKKVHGYLYHFSIGTIPSLDNKNMRLRILNDLGKYKDSYVFVETNRAIYDMSGHAVWYLPDIDNLDGEYPVRDLKISPQGTITLLAGISGQNGYEINYNGKVLWKTPNDSEHRYHHEFMRLKNGHYMVMAEEPVNEYLSKKTTPGKSGFFVFSQEEPQPDTTFLRRQQLQFYKKGQFAEVIEYDAQGKASWTYRSSKYFNNSDLYFLNNTDLKSSYIVHDNAFCFDEQKEELYISYRDINRIVKIKYPDGNTLATYGELFAPGAVQNKGKGFFCGEHNCRVAGDGSLYLFNNNSCNKNSFPTIVFMKQPDTENDSLKKIWEYECSVDSMSEEDQKKMYFFNGGSVYELPNGAVFATMGGKYSKLFIVNKNKEILWSALAEKWDNDKKEWWVQSQYRSTIITRAQLEQLIWNSEK
jgi:hypothetical protein